MKKEFKKKSLVGNRWNQRNFEKKSIKRHKITPQQKTENSNRNKIITPPIVGVPIFFTIWSCGPSSRIGLTIFLFEKKFIKGPPIYKTRINEVNKDSPVLKVIYLKTFKNPKLSTKLSKNW